MNNDDRDLIEAWVQKLTAGLGHSELEINVDEVLNLAGTAARTVTRPAAPLTTFIVGYAAGIAAAAGVMPVRAMHDAITTAEGLSDPQDG